MYQNGMNSKSINSAKYGKENGNNQQKSQLGQDISKTLSGMAGLEQVKSGKTWFERAQGIAQIVAALAGGG